MSEQISFEVLRCRELQAEGLSRKEIADVLGLSERQVKRRLSTEFYVRYIQTPHDETVVGDEKDPVSDISYNAKRPDLFNVKPQERRRQIYDRTKNIFPTSFLVINDLHVPFHDINVFNEAIDYAKERGIERVVVNGDLLDLYAVSSFARNKQVSLKEEYELGVEILDILSEEFEEVYVTEGNHERRIKNWIFKNIDPSIQWLFKVDLLDQMADQFDNVFYAGGWWLKIGSVIFAHPSNYSSVPGRTTMNTSDHFRARGVDHSAIVLGHTHKFFNAYYKDVLCLETGCQAYDMDYLVESGKIVRDSWKKGFAVVSMDTNGDIDFNRTEIVKYEGR